MTTDWKNLITEIKKGNCAIFLGHGLLAEANGAHCYSCLCDKLANDYANYLSAYYPEENFFLFKEPKYRTKVINEIEDFYNHLQVDPEVRKIYEKLAEIPVRLYISISPDQFLKEVLAENVEFSFFKDDQRNTTELEATKSKPFLYNIFGSIDHSDSLVISHDDLFDFLKKILGENGLPFILKKFFREDAGGEVIFLGFDFRKWYVRLLLRIFNLSKPSNATNRTAYYDSAMLEEEKLFASNHFKVDFIETRVKEFVDILHKKCGDEGILRKIGESKKEAKKITEEEKSRRVNEIKMHLVTANKLRGEYETKLMFSNDPKEMEKCRTEITEIEERIKSWNNELSTLYK